MREYAVWLVRSCAVKCKFLVLVDQSVKRVDVHGRRHGHNVRNLRHLGDQVVRQLDTGAVVLAAAMTSRVIVEISILRNDNLLQSATRFELTLDVSLSARHKSKHDRNA